MSPQEHHLRLIPPWTDPALVRLFAGALQTDVKSSLSEEGISMLKALNTLHSEPGTPVEEDKKPPIADASFDAPGNFALKDNFYKAGQYVAVHAPLVRAKKGDPPPPPQPLVPQKVNTKTTPVAILAKQIKQETTTPDQDVLSEEKKRSSPEPEPPAKQPKKIPVTPDAKAPESPVAVQLPPASPPLPKPSAVPPPMPAQSTVLDLPPDDDEDLSVDEPPPPIPPPRSVAAKKSTPAKPKSVPLSARAELLIGTGINENSYDSAEEPSDGVSLGAGSNGDDSDESEGPARPLPPVHLSYEQRQAAEIAAVRAQHNDTAPAKGKGKKKLSVPKVEHINATAENAPIPPGFVEPKPKKTKAVKEDKVLLSKLINSERFFHRITPSMLKQKPQDLDSREKGPNIEFVKLWNYAVDLALDVEFKRTVNRTEAKAYGAEYESRWLELAKQTVYAEKPDDAREARILALHRLFWCYHNVALLVPEGAVSTSECWLVFSSPRKGQNLHIAQEVRVSFHYRYYEGILFAYKGIHPWEFLKGRATFMVRRIRQNQIPLEKVEERLKNWENNGVFRLMEWVNSTIMGGWNFFT